jgi:hypothetical protein
MLLLLLPLLFLLLLTLVPEIAKACLFTVMVIRMQGLV